MTGCQVLEFVKEEGEIDWIGKETAWSSKAMQQAQEKSNHEGQGCTASFMG